jgi:hypothetical protein
MPPTYAQFVDALRTPAQRSAIGLVITDEEAASLLAHDAWMRGYYASWLELFPIGDSLVAPPRGARVASVLIIGGLIAVCIAVAAVALLLPHPSAAISVAADDHPETTSSAPATPSASNPTGLTSAEVDLLDSELAVTGGSIDKLRAGGTTLGQLRELATLETGLTDLACGEFAKLPDGFNTGGAKDKFVAGLMKGITLLGRTVTPTQGQAEGIWTATERYCISKSTPAPTTTP